MSPEKPSVNKGFKWHRWHQGMDESTSLVAELSCHISSATDMHVRP